MCLGVLKGPFNVILLRRYKSIGLTELFVGLKEALFLLLFSLEVCFIPDTFMWIYVSWRRGTPSFFVKYVNLLTYIKFFYLE